MPLNPQYMLAPSLQEYFVDKDTGLPLSGGYVFFYSDISRTVLKNVYTLSGSPPNYQYTALPNPIQLSAVGTIQDVNGNDVLPYYFPFDAFGNVELYYVVVQSSGFVLQFTRQGWPNFSEFDEEDTITTKNYIPNGQFLAHNNILPTNTAMAGQITNNSSGVYNIAQGGWTFERPAASTATDFVLFDRIGSYTGSISASPRYQVEIKNTSPIGGDAYKYLGIRFPDVNKFSSSSGQTYTFGFTGQSLSGNLTVQLLLIKYFGAGGSPTYTSTSISSFTLTINEQAQQAHVSFGNNSMYDIGPNDDDYVQLVLAFPTNQAFDATFTDFILAPGSVDLQVFPTQTNAEMLDEGVAGWMPTPNANGNDLYLPLILTPSGMAFDHSQIGKVNGSISPTPGIGELLCDGSQYQTSLTLNSIPLSRLQSVVYNSTLNLPIYGTGGGFVTALQQTSTTTNLLIALNSFGNSNLPADGTIPTGFTFPTSTTPGLATNLNLKTYNYNPGSNAGVLARSTMVGFITMWVYSPGTPAPFTVTQISDVAGQNATFQLIVGPGSTTSLAGKTLQFYILPGVGGGTPYYLWYQVDGSPASPPLPPIVGSTAIRVSVASTNTAQEVANIVMYALSAGYEQIVQTTNTMPAGSFWTFGAGGNNYFVWYKVAGVGISPVVAGTLFGIEVDIPTGATATTVATATQIAINQAYFAVPDLRGLFLRGYDPNFYWDMDAAQRFGNPATVQGNILGTLELDIFKQHNHPPLAPTGTNFIMNTTGSASSSSGSGNISSLPTTGNTGGSETRPVNANVNWFIKY